MLDLNEYKNEVINYSKINWLIYFLIMITIPLVLAYTLISGFAVSTIGVSLWFQGYLNMFLVGLFGFVKFLFLLILEMYFFIRNIKKYKKTHTENSFKKLIIWTSLFVIVSTMFCILVLIFRMGT